MSTPLTTAARATGAWADGDRTPLNDNERFKLEDDGLNVRQRIETIFSREGFGSIPVDDLRGRMRWWGLYTQRRPGIDGGQTAKLSADELDDSYFMLRIRSDGGALSEVQLRTIAGISTEFARDTADISDRQNIQLHWIRVEDVPEIWRRIEAVGLNSAQACGDVPRVILGSPVAGIDVHEIIDGTPAIHEILDRYLLSPEFSNLPRKFKTAVSGSPSLDVAHEANDVSFVGVVHPEHGPGFDVWVGGGLSTNPIFAQRLGAWVPIEDVPAVWAGVVGIFRDYGYRRLRNRARLKFLVSDWGAERFREVLETEYLGRRLLDGPAPVEDPERRRDHLGVHPQVDGRFWVGVAPIGGRVSGTTLTAVADLAARHGSGRVRLTAHQKLLVLDVPEAEVATLVVELDALGLPANASEWRRGVLACTGIEFCKLALVETKARARSAVEELERRIPDLDAPVTIHVNGCPNSCARFQVADIGLKGLVMTGASGETVEGFQVHLGGALGGNARLARKTRALRVEADDLVDYVEHVVTRFRTDQAPGESFAEWAHRADEEALR
ncbi:MAG TPA: nitrite/sulfite reductase [Dermatophilaceae bacterium]|jgi:sulfite reductase (ferredoxin)|nr:nitrite/sulfite reductase [Dermatophilaceae bacterium]HOA56634.1 nitrite/sulfite reductase [Dermatophilaceae bacterium]HOF35936.1 nitrite/sulfite reductase [Dermatophilaceae bacterium]HOR16004.1 nitrite/sulfite reductase [Dermatophilaceae bacterium]HOV00513.1 nitrite/sulfite reductase [Dermatophilaceae bacterium]